MSSPVFTQNGQLPLSASIVDEQLGGNLEPIRNNNFEVIFNSIPTKDGNTVANGSRNITLSVASFGGASIGVGTIQAFYGNDALNFAGKPEYGSGNITLNDYVNIQTADSIYKWFTCVYDASTGEIGYASEYKVPGYLYEYDTKGKLVRKWKMQGCFPTNVAVGDKSQEGGSMSQITVALSYDKIYLESSSMPEGLASLSSSDIGVRSQ